MKVQNVVCCSLAFAALASGSAGAQATRERCGVIVEGPAGSKLEVVADLSILQLSDGAAQPRVNGKITAVACDRDVLAFGPHDYKVIRDWAVPLYISSGERAGWLEISNGQLGFSFSQGRMTAEEEGVIQTKLNEWQLIFQKPKP